VIGPRLGARLRARLVGNGRDRGAVAAIAAILFGSGVVLGMAALVVDVGNIYVERERLQSGADAAVLRAGQVCANDLADCTVASVSDVAGRFARDNAAGGQAGASVCGRGGGLPACPAPSGGLDDCVRVPPGAGDYVEVHTNTLRNDGSTLLPPIFAQAVLDGFRGAAVTSCARATWGPPARTRGLAMTISTCDWKRLTGEGTTFPSAEQAISLYDETDATACGVAGTDAGNRGGFRWLTGADGDCLATVSVDSNYGATLGQSRPAGCPDELIALVDASVAVPVPIFAAVDTGGAGATYTVQGFAAFVVTGWHLPASDHPSPTRSSCDAGATLCVYGYFTRAFVRGGGAVTGPDLGARIVALIG
jgi:hypothetical protein